VYVEKVTHLNPFKLKKVVKLSGTLDDNVCVPKSTEILPGHRNVVFSMHLNSGLIHNKMSLNWNFLLKVTIPHDAIQHRMVLKFTFKTSPFIKLPPITPPHCVRSCLKAHHFVGTCPNLISFFVRTPSEIEL
jgi:hypothetical protein